MRQFQVVEELPEPPRPGIPETVPLPAPRDRVGEAAASALGFALKALSQKALVALSSLFTLLTVGSAFFLWHYTPDPNAHQIVSLTIYALFVLAANVIVRRL